MATLDADKKIGLLGGCFNPAHLGHLAISKDAIKIIGLEEVWWLIHPNPPHKSRSDMASLAKRINNAKAIVDTDAILVKDAERQFNHTFPMLQKLKVDNPRTKFLWMMGADNLATFDRWYKWQQIVMFLPIAVFHRPGFETDASNGVAYHTIKAYEIGQRDAKSIFDRKTPAWVHIQSTQNSLSSTKIRLRAKEKSH